MWAQKRRKRREEEKLKEKPDDAMDKDKQGAAPNAVRDPWLVATLLDIQDMQVSKAARARLEYSAMRASRLEPKLAKAKAERQEITSTTEEDDQEQESADDAGRGSSNQGGRCVGIEAADAEYKDRASCVLPVLKANIYAARGLGEKLPHLRNFAVM